MGKLKVLVPIGESDRLVKKIGDEAHADYTDRELELPTLVLPSRSGGAAGVAIARGWKVTVGGLLQASLERDEQGTFVFGQMPQPEQVADKDMLIVDGACKAGEKLSLLTDLLYMAGASSVKSAVLLYKPNETTTGFVPDFVGDEVTDGAFYVFDSERAEYLPEPEEPTALGAIMLRGDAHDAGS